MNKGISLIVLVITILVIIILAGAVIVSLANNNPIASANKAAFETSVASYNSELAIFLSNQYLQNNLFDPSTFNTGIWNGTEGNITGTIKQYITSMKPADGVKFEIQGSKLVYVGTDQTEKDWLTEMGIINGEITPPEAEIVYTVLGLNVVATENATFNGVAATYNNPIIPKGFRAINDVTTWPTDWNAGLVIEDASGNQFVWVPVDGTNVPYAKWCTISTSYVSTTEDSLPLGVIEQDQITKYGGFYIARYESMFDYNGGSIRVASKKSINKTTTSWNSTRNATYNGYLWNYINYTDSRQYSLNMSASYGYDTSKVLTHLITGTQWDTTMKWIDNSGKSVTDSRSWGNYVNSISPANVSGFGSIQISGYNDNWKVKNIFDLAGNTREWTNEIYSSNPVYRGGACLNDGSTNPAAWRNSNGASVSSYTVGFRVALYIL